MNTIAIYAVVVLTLFMSGFGFDRYFFYLPYKAEVKAESIAQLKINEATITQLKQATKKAQDDNTKRTAAVRSFYQRLYPDASSTGMSKARETSISTDYSPNNLPPTSKLAEDCAVTTVNLITLQEWAEKVSQ